MPRAYGCDDVMLKGVCNWVCLCLLSNLCDVCICVLVRNSVSAFALREKLRSRAQQSMR